MHKHAIILLGLLGAVSFSACHPMKIVSVVAIGPENFQGGMARVSLENVKSSENLMVVAVHGTQATSEGFSYAIKADGLDGNAPKIQKASSKMMALSNVHPPRHSPLWTKVWNDLSQEMHIESEEELPPSTCLPPYARGQVCEFSILDYKDDFHQEPATVRYVSEHFVAFVENKSRGTMSNDDVKDLINWLEKRGYSSDQKYFGDLPDVDGNGKAFIVFSSHLLDPKTSKGMVGYVAPWDLTPVSGYPSNASDVLFVLTPNVFQAAGHSESEYYDYAMKSTMTHELKHLIAMGYRTKHHLPFEQLWLEEPSAVAAEQLAGFGARIGYPQAEAAAQLRAPQNFALQYWGRPESRDENSGLYGMNFLFLWRQAEKVGHDIFWRGLVQSPRQGVANVEKQTGASMGTAMLDFAKLLYFDHTGALVGADNYKQLDLRDGSWEDVGTLPLGNGSNFGSVRSMAYHIGRGHNERVDLRFDTDFNQPYFLVIRYQP